MKINTGLSPWKNKYQSVPMGNKINTGLSPWEHKYWSVPRLIQEEKETTEQRAEELESRVGSVDTTRWQSVPEQSFERSASPTISGGSTPTPQPSLHYQSRDYLEKYNTVSGGGQGGGVVLKITCKGWGESVV